MNYRSSDASLIAKNITAHDKIAKKYEQNHGEIYNDIEQQRLLKMLEKTLAGTRTTSSRKVALDFGCGAGNLTGHLSSLGLDVLACDVSQGFLDLIDSKIYGSNVKTVKLNGTDLSNIPDNTVDIVATYSVLHHVPDYLRIVSEFVRVLKPGGIVFIDHELCLEVWEPTPQRLEFLNEINSYLEPSWHKYLRWRNYVNWFILKFINPRYRPEGDIHVFEDDHIEWDMIEALLETLGMEIVLSETYLLFKRGYDYDVYRKYASRTADMQLVLSRKKMG